MGYDLHITKADNWLEADAHPISSAEVEQLLQADETLVLSSTDYHERSGPDGETQRIYALYWPGPTEEVAFWFMDGEITSKNVDGATILKMIEIAERLQARVLGDDGEAYTASSSPPGWETTIERVEEPSDEAMQRFLIAAALFSLCVLILMLVVAT